MVTINTQSLHMHRRMMYLCSLAYSRAKVRDQQRANWLDRDKLIGLIGDPQLIERDTRFAEGAPMDIAVFGKIDGHWVIAFRGTQAPQPGLSSSDKISLIRDWINNGEVIGDDNGLFPSGFVHDGFAESAMGLLQGEGGVLELLQSALLTVDAPRSLILTGHSKGGALAMLAACYLKSHLAGQLDEISVVTFGSARCGDAAFGQIYRSAGIDTTRYESDSDVVPLLPSGAGLPPIVRQLLRNFQLEADDQTIGFLPVGKRVPGNIPTAADWFVAYSPLIAMILTDRRALLDKLIWSHGIEKGKAYDQIVPT